MTDLSHLVIDSDGDISRGFLHLKQHNGGLITYLMRSPIWEEQQRMSPAQRKRFKTLMDFGWGNGYIAIPEGHPFLTHITHAQRELKYIRVGEIVDITYQQMNELCPIEGNEWTFSVLSPISAFRPILTSAISPILLFRIFGFDTAHSYTKGKDWTEEKIIAVIESFVNIINEYP